VYKDDENSRGIISTEAASANFDLRGLDRIWLYDSGNNKISSKLQLKSVEFLDQSISPVFIAVYETAMKYQKISYCIGGFKPKFDDLDIKMISDREVISEIEQGFEIREVSMDHNLEYFQLS
jgi:hypothetical protein